MHQPMQLTIDHDNGGPAAGPSILARLGRRRGWFLLGFTVTACAIAGVFSALPPSYRASAALMVASNEAVIRMGTSSADAQRLGDPADIESQMLMLRSPRLDRMILQDRAVQQALVEDCKAAEDGSWATKLIVRAVKPADCEMLRTVVAAGLQRLEGAFSIGPTGRSRVIEVSFVSPVPQTAVIIANALVDAYLRDDKERKVDTHDNAINWLNAEIDRSGRELRQAELDVESYRSEHGIVRGQNASISSERLSSLNQQLAVAEAAEADAQARLAQFSSSGSDAQEVLTSRTIADLKQLSSQLGSHMADLRQRLGDAHPSVLAAADQKRDIDRRIGQESHAIGASLRRDAAAASARVADLRSQFNSLKHDVGTAGGAEAGIAIMVRDVEARREIYVEQLKKVNILQTERRLLTGDARLVHYAEQPERPWFPKKLPFLAVGFVLSSAMGALAGLLRDRGDHTLRTSSNLPRVSGIPVAGYIPWVRGRRNSALLQVLDPSPLQEAVRALFGRFFLVPGEAPRTLMVGSSDTGEGKTFLALAMGLFATGTGRKVLVIEADLRRPTFRSCLKLPESPGLSEFLSSTVPIRGLESLEAFIQPHAGMHLIVAGAPIIASTELLSSGRLDALISIAKAHYDLVIVDSPPTLLLMDAQILARRMDGIIYCTSFGRSQLDRVLAGMHALAGAGGRVLGMVVGGARNTDTLDYGIVQPRRPYVLAAR